MLGRYFLKGIKTPLRNRNSMVAARNWGEDNSRNWADDASQQKRGYKGVKELLDEHQANAAKIEAVKLEQIESDVCMT